ncbi:MAG: hypothetical protein R3F31_09205 [Verrucomicrobiales bacterium]
MLEKEDLVRIVDLEIGQVEKRLREKDILLTFDAAAKEMLIKEGYDPNYGARPMRRAVERHLEDPLAEHLRGNIKSGDRIAVTCEEDGKTLKFTPNKGEEGNEEPCEVVDSAG